MTETALDRDSKTIISLSRNDPIALVVGAAGFLASSLIDELLNIGIQVVGVDDLSKHPLKNLEVALSNQNFHLLDQHLTNLEIKQLLATSLPRLDYGLFILDLESKANSDDLPSLMQLITEIREKINQSTDPIFQHLHKGEKPKVCLVSNVIFYESHLSEELVKFKELEVTFAKLSKESKLNSRIIRLANLFGSRMSLDSDDSLTRLIKATVVGGLKDEAASGDFGSRNLFVGDAVNLIIKSILQGNTNSQIFDGVSLSPVKISEIKQQLQILPEEFKFNPFPTWTSPNLDRTVTNLNWHPTLNLTKQLEKTVNFFKELTPADLNTYLKEQTVEVEQVEKVEEIIEEAKQEEVQLQQEKNIEQPKRWSFADFETRFNKEEPKVAKELSDNFSQRLTLLVAGLLILIGLVIPVGKFMWGELNLTNQLQQTIKQFNQSNFEKAIQSNSQTKQTVGESASFLNIFSLAKGSRDSQASQLVSVTAEVSEGIDQTILATQKLSEGLSSLTNDQYPSATLYQESNFNFQSGFNNLLKAEAILSDEGFRNSYPTMIRGKLLEMLQTVTFFKKQAEGGEIATNILPLINTEVSKTYLLILIDNKQLRGSGGVVLGLGKVKVNQGKIESVKVVNVTQLDQAGSKTALPEQLKTDFKTTNLLIKDSLFNADFAQSAQGLINLYSQQTGESSDGVIAVNFSSLEQLLDTLGPVQVDGYNTQVNSGNVEGLINADSSFITPFWASFLNKLFYTPSQNWVGVGQVVGEGLMTKDVNFYFKDTQIENILRQKSLTAEVKRGEGITAGESADYLAIFENNLSNIDNNQFLSKQINLSTNIDGQGKITHQLDLKLELKNAPNNLSNRLKIYLPLDSKVESVLINDQDVAGEVTTSTDFGRLGQSLLLNLTNNQVANLEIKYELNQALSFVENSVNYNLLVQNQAGSKADQLNLDLIVDKNLKITSFSPAFRKNGNQFNSSKNLNQDSNYKLTLSK